MRFASDFLRSKTTLAAFAAVLLALADAASKGSLTWQQGIVIVLAVLGATIRDTIARQGEQTSLNSELYTRTLEAAALASRSTQQMAATLTSLLPSLAETPEADGEADRPEEAQ